LYNFNLLSGLRGGQRAMEKVAMSKRLPSRSSLRQLRRQAKDLLTDYRGGEPAALARFRVSLPRLAGASDATVLAAGFTLQDAQRVLAVEHGFASWGDLRRHVEGAAGDSWQAALDAVKAGDHRRLSLLIAGEPDLPGRRQPGENTLLHVASWSKEVEIVRLLLRAGADVNARAGEGWMPLHNAAEGNHVENLMALLEGGADVHAEACGDGGTALAHALFGGAREAADILAARAVVPANLRVAAGLGDLGRLRACFDDGGALRSEAGRQRGFYRHHAEYPEWTPRDDPQEILDEALVYACLNGRGDAVELLLDRGANVNGMPYNMAGLHAAVQGNHPAIVQALLARGADPSLRDRMHDGTPHGWSRALERQEIRDLLAPLTSAAVAQQRSAEPSLFDLIDAGMEERVAQRLAAGADPNARRTRRVQISGRGISEVEESALEAAAAAGQRGVGERLAAAGAEVDLQAAAFLDRVDQLSRLLGDGHPDDRRDAFGRTALHLAILGGAETAARWLIQRGASVQTFADTFSFGAQALHVAAAAGASARMLDLLITAGAQVNEVRNPGTPLRVALKHGQHATAAHLRARGAVE
jgi:ankyrin repeat protein